MAISMAVSVVVIAFIMGILVLKRELSKTAMERYTEQVAADTKKKDAPTTKEKLKKATEGSLGWGLSIEPYLWFMLFVFMSFAAVLTLADMSPTTTAMLSLPLSFLTAYAVATITHSKRQEQFQTNLISALDTFSQSLQQGATKLEAFNMLIPNLPEPLKTELENAVSKTASGSNLADAVADIYNRYPSKAMHMLIICLYIEDGSIATAIGHIADSIRNDIGVRKEAEAKITKDAREYYLTSGMIILISVFVLREMDLESLLKPSVVSGVMWAVAANFAFGVIRARKTIASIRKL